MGGGSSSPFNAVPVEHELPRHNLGKTVHIVGKVSAADGTVLSSPFASHRGPAIRVTASRQGPASSGLQSNSHGAFRAEAALDFFVTDGTSKVRVCIPDVTAWAWRLRETHSAFNIMRDMAGMLHSGGNPNEHRKIEPRPDAAQFWERLNGGRDPLERMQLIPAVRNPGRAASTAMGVGGFAEDLQRPRMAVEQTLQLGDTVAVLGLLGESADGELTITPQLANGKGTINNDSRIASSLVGRSLTAPPPDDLRVVPMGKHKKAKNYAGKKW